MKLTDQEKQELLSLIPNEEFSPIKKKLFADRPGSPEAIKEFTDMLKFFNELSGHKQKPFRPIIGDSFF